MEHLIKNELNRLSYDQVQNVKAHAKLADEHGENHNSHTILEDWIDGLRKAGGYALAGGVTFKLTKELIRVIRNH